MYFSKHEDNRQMKRRRYAQCFQYCWITCSQTNQPKRWREEARKITSPTTMFASWFKCLYKRFCFVVSFVTVCVGPRHNFAFVVDVRRKCWDAFRHCLYIHAAPLVRVYLDSPICEQLLSFCIRSASALLPSCLSLFAR